MKSPFLFVVCVTVVQLSLAFHIRPSFLNGNLKSNQQDNLHGSEPVNLPLRTTQVMQFDRQTKWLKTAIGLGIASMGIIVASPNYAAQAADTVTVGKCLLQNCQLELAACILNPKCLANVVCLNTCNNRPDEAECQIKCGDTFENEVVGRFNTCAVSAKKCVPQKQDTGEYPLPAQASMVKKFDASVWEGKYYISAGLNKVFDTFDCQAHFFNSPSPGRFYAKINWRVKLPDGEFFTKNAIQRFIQDPENPAHFINHGNDYLDYKDDWYIIDYSPEDEYVLVYYRGSNDAWDGYGGAFLYSRSPTVKPEWIPRLEKAVSSMGLKYRWSDFTETDNSCAPQVGDETALRYKYITNVLVVEEEEIQQQLTLLRSSAGNTVLEEEKELENVLSNFEKQIEVFERELAEKALQIEKEIVKDVVEAEEEIVKDVVKVEQEIVKDVFKVEEEIVKDINKAFKRTK